MLVANKLVQVVFVDFKVLVEIFVVNKFVDVIFVEETLVDNRLFIVL